jgi:hypothetical protein
MMNEEHRQIMEMLAAGTITAEEAQQLLDAIEAEPFTSTGPTQRIGSQPQAAADQTASTFANLTIDQLIELQNHGVDPNFMRQMQAAGFADLSIDQLIELYNHGVGPDFIHQMRAVGR